MDEYELLLNILLLIVLAKLLGELFDRISLPRVMGELIAGLILGPSFLGIIDPHGGIEILAIIGVVFFMMSAGLEIDLNRFVRHFREGLVVALSGVIIPLSLGLLIGYIHGLDSIQAFAIGTCLSITAIGLSVRVLMDLRMLRSRLGLTTVNAAVVDDVIGLVLMSLAFSLAIGERSFSHAIILLLLSSLTFIAIAFLLGITITRKRRLRLRLAKYLGMGIKSSSLRLAIAIALAFLLSFTARLASLHEIVGAFIAGMILRNILSEEAEKEIYDFTFAFFALLFFTYVGISTDIRSIMLISEIAISIILFAFIGKLLGGLIGALISRLSLREAVIVGIAMNGRGAVELAIATAFYSMNIFTTEIFSALVLMATITSIATPLLLKIAVKILVLER
ncbi:MAG: hypothetical protein DRO15_05130 [Thermoprotei archaeon]|nr:MAG: hypothetical protein DRO15_05130 [Thermoprotei archaeon]